MGRAQKSRPPDTILGGDQIEVETRATAIWIDADRVHGSRVDEIPRQGMHRLSEFLNRLRDGQWAGAKAQQAGRAMSIVVGESTNLEQAAAFRLARSMCSCTLGGENG